MAIQTVSRRDDDGLTLSVMARSAVSRVLAMVGIIALLWLGVLWAVAQP